MYNQQFYCLHFAYSYDKISRPQNKGKGDFMQDIGTQFHIRCNEGDVGRYVFLPGDPGRCEAIAQYFGRIRRIYPQLQHIQRPASV